MSSQTHREQLEQVAVAAGANGPVAQDLVASNAAMLEEMASTGSPSNPGLLEAISEPGFFDSVLSVIPGLDLDEAVTAGGGVDAQVVFDGGGPVEMEVSEFATEARKIFPALDAEGDGFLSEEDLNAAMKNPDLTPEQAAAVATMKKYRSDLESMGDDEFGIENDGITMQDLLHYQATGEVDKDLRKRIEHRYRKGKARAAEASDELFSEEIPDVAAMRQGAIGDCWFLAAAGSYCAQDPGRVVDMIDTNKDGTYTVTFPNGQRATVDKPTPAEIALYATSGTDGHWLTVLEKAYGKIDGEDQDSLDGGRAASAGTDVFSEKGSSDLDALSLTSKKDTREKLTRAFAGDRPVTAQIRTDLPLQDGRREGLPMAHVYSVTDYDPATGTVTLRNPWGHTEYGDDGNNDGTFEMSVEEFDRLYTTAAYAD